MYRAAMCQKDGQSSERQVAASQSGTKGASGQLMPMCPRGAPFPLAATSLFSMWGKSYSFASGTRNVGA